MNVQKKDANLSLEKRLASGILEEMVENFKGCTIQSTISDSAHSDSDEQVYNTNDSEEQVDARNWLINDSVEQVGQINDSEKQVDAIINDSEKQVDATSDSEKLVVTGSDPKSDPRSDPKADTHTTHVNLVQKLLISRFVPNIIPVVIRPINLSITADMMGVQDILSPPQTVLPKASITDAACSCARIFRWTSGKVSLTNRDNATSRDISYNENSRLSSHGPSCIGNSVSPTRTGNQDIFNPSHPSTVKRGRNVEPFDAFIDGFSAINGHCTSYFSGVIGLEAVSAEVADVNLQERMNFASNSVLGETPKFVDLGLSPVHTTDKLKSVISPATRSGGLTDHSNWIASRHCIAEKRREE